MRIETNNAEVLGQERRVPRRRRIVRGRHARVPERVESGNRTTEDVVNPSNNVT